MSKQSVKEAQVEKARASRAKNDALKEGLKKQTFELKIIENKLSGSKKRHIEGIFREAKWLTNEAIASDSVFDYQWNKDTVEVKLPDGSIEEREYFFSPKLVLEKTFDKVKQDIKNLSKAKQAGRKVGRLGFKKEVKSVPLGNRSVSVDYQKDSKRLGIAKVGRVHVAGLKQLEAVEMIGQAELAKRADGHYIKLLCYVKHNENKTFRRNFGDLKATVEESVGIDMGVLQQVIASNGLVVKPAEIGELDRLRGLSAKLSRQRRGSNNYGKTLRAIKREYLKLSYRKEHLARQLVRSLLDENEVIYFQDEQISSWRKRNGFIKAGRKLQHGILGRVKELLKNLIPSGRAVMLSKNVPTTQLCVCGAKNKHHVRERMYHCDSCGYVMDRDTHAALNMIRIGQFGHRVGNDLRKQSEVPAHLWSSGEPDYPTKHRITLEHTLSGVLATGNNVSSLDSEIALV